MRRSEVVGMRVDERERALIRAAAAAEGVDTAELLRRIVLPAVGRRVVESAGALAGAGSAAPSVA